MMDTYDTFDIFLWTLINYMMWSKNLFSKCLLSHFYLLNSLKPHYSEYFQLSID